VVDSIRYPPGQGVEESEEPDGRHHIH
jgi:hypothetical protein